MDMSEVDRWKAYVAKRDEHIADLKNQIAVLDLQLTTAKASWWVNSLEVFRLVGVVTRLEGDLGLANAEVKRLQGQINEATENCAACPTQEVRDKLAICRQALQDIVNPIGKICREMPEDAKLNHHYAALLSRDVNYLQDIAEKALKASTTAEEGAK